MRQERQEPVYSATAAHGGTERNLLHLKVRKMKYIEVLCSGVWICTLWKLHQVLLLHYPSHMAIDR